MRCRAEVEFVWLSYHTVLYIQCIYTVYSVYTVVLSHDLPPPTQAAVQWPLPPLKSVSNTE